MVYAHPVGSSGMKRKGRRRLPKVQEPRAAPTPGGMWRTWFLRYPDDVNVGGFGGPHASSTPNPVKPGFLYWLRYAGFVVIVGLGRISGWRPLRRRHSP